MIPLSVPNLSGREIEYVTKCLETGWISTAGEFVSRFESEFAVKLGVDDAVSTVNGTAALHLGLRLLGVEAGDLVVVPNVTFVASANAIKYLGADPVLLDIDPQSWQMNLDLLERFLKVDCRIDDDQVVRERISGRRVSAVMAVHVQGHMCDMTCLTGICDGFGLPLIEDAAEALGATYDGKPAGTFGDIGCFSFNGNKIMSTGGGGMLISKSATTLEHARHIATTAKTDPLRYHHDEVGYNYRLVNVLAAIGVAQLEQLENFIESKRSIAHLYEKELVGVGDIDFQVSSGLVSPNHWLFTVTTEKMEELLATLNNNGVMSRPFWAPMNTLPMYADSTYVHDGDVSRRIHKKALSIPCSTNLSSNDQWAVINEIKRFFGG